MSLIVVNGNNLDLLKTYPDNYFDSVVTDPPYGLGKELNAVEVMTAWATTGYHEIEGKGFMGKEWDAFVPQPVFWKEVFRVLKHGGHVIAFYGTRTYDWGVMAMRFAGFEVRDCIQWIYGSGFPKSHNIGKAVDKIEGNEREVVGIKENKINLNATKEGDKSFYENAWQNKDYVDLEITKGNSEWEGWGSALKPANEPIVLARKPLEKGLSIAENVLKWGTGGINIDGCRITTEDKSYYITNSEKSQFEGNTYGFKDYANMHKRGGGHNEGRFPANIILTHHPECECKGLKKVKGVTGGKNDIIVESKFGQVSDIPQKPFDYADENGQETVEDWNCHPDCPIKIMDEQSGISKSPSKVTSGGRTFHGGIYDDRAKDKLGFSDSGGASRFFYCAKASKSERNKGLEGFDEKRSSAYGYEIGLGEKGEGMFKDRNPIKQNFHPTVKPVKLMQYLVRLVTPPNGKVLDPFCGSGTTGIACKLERFEFVGIEQDAEYCKIAEARIKAQNQNLSLF